MGWTRSRRYANHASGKKYSDVDKDLTTTKKEKVTKKAAEASKDFNSRNKAHKLKTLTKEVAPRILVVSSLLYFFSFLIFLCFFIFIIYFLIRHQVKKIQ